MANRLPQELLLKLEPLKNQRFTNEEKLLGALQPLVGSDQMEEVKGIVLENISTVKTSEIFPEIEIGYYSILTFGSLLFMVVGLYLPQVLKLSVGPIAMEKISVDQAQAGGTLGISK
jgi:hypothetical protein